MEGNFIFKELSFLVLTYLSLPLSNTFVERVFSIMNLVKSKIRNKMRFELLDTTLRIRLYFTKTDMCCNSFQPSPQTFQKFIINHAMIICDHSVTVLTVFLCQTLPVFE